MNREGIPTVIVLLTTGLALSAVGRFYRLYLIFALGIVVLLLALFSIYFFRDPMRRPPTEAGVVVSPCDGKVISVEEADEPEFIEGKAIKISIFMSVFNIHVNYVPYHGTVDFIRYHRGKYFRADDPRASLHNVNILTGLITEEGKLAFKQATGMVARRLVNHLRLGDQVTTGQKFGIIKFGSRMEVFLPLHAVVAVKKGEKLRAGESIIASFR